MEDPEERKRRQNRERQARYRKRKLEEANAEEIAAKKQKHAEYVRGRRQQETIEQTESRRQADRLRHEHETLDEQQVRLEAAAQSQRLRRAMETPEETQARLVANNLSHQLRLQHETEEEREIRLLANLSYRHMTQELQSQAIRAEAIAYDDNVAAHSCGALNVLCEFCLSKNFIDERPPDKKFNLCCRKGKIKLPRSVDIHGNELIYPDFLRDLLTNRQNPNYVKFRENIRCYNNAVSFASMGAKIVEPPGRGPYVFKVHGQTYHKTSHLVPPNSQKPQYAQLYVIDSTQATSVREQHIANQNCSTEILNQIDRFFRMHNRLAQTYTMMREVEARHAQEAIAAGQEPPQISMLFRRDRQSDQRRYNAPSANEVAMIFVDTEGEPPFERDIRVYPRNPEDHRKQFVNLKILSPNMDPMTYALLYPYGEPGWQPNWQCESFPDVQLNRVRVNISMQQFKVAQTAIRDGEFNPVLRAGKLTQQWMVDSYLQVEANNLNFIRQNQKKLRAEQYQGLMDHLENAAQGQNVAAGVPLILPSTFSGSPRNMRESCCDAMSIFAKIGTPDLFITFTANPNWPEVLENLNPGETPADRPDIVARVFKIKLAALLKELVECGVLGKVIAYVYTIEFQKRGLPHAHILLTLAAEHKFTSAERIDRHVSAEIPSEETNPRLREIILRCMTHGPCGRNSLNSPCMENGECKKKFPKGFNETTKPNVEGYPVYRRREGMHAQVRGMRMDNRWIVPYSPYLSLKFNAHINVEVCTSLKAIKYIYKYIYKGFDCANVIIRADGQQQLNYDEITNFVNCRYVSAPEAIWRMRENKMHDRSHSVMRLPIHLPNQQRITFEEGNEEEAIVAAQTRTTKLESWFNLNSVDPTAQEYLYTEIPNHFVYVKNNWQRRLRGGEKIVPRMYTVSPRDEERFYMRTLLLHVRGADSFEALRSFDGILYDTYKAAAQARGLLESDDEWVRCMQDAVTYQMPRQLRETFCYIIVFGRPSQVLLLWQQFYEDMILDFVRSLPESEAINMALHDIQKTLKEHNYTCEKVGLPIPQGPPPAEDAPYDITQEAYDAQIRIPMLNEKQREAFDIIRDALDFDNGEARCFFIDGPGGSGKTFLYKTLLAFVRGRDEIAMPFATTGIAGTLLKGGRTVHSGFKLPVPIDETSVCLMRLNSDEAAMLRDARLIIIDEATMLYKDSLRCIDRLLRDIMENQRPFGGKVFLLGGDFRQTLPVVTRGTRADIIENCIKSSPLWRQFRQLTLSANIRSEGQQAHNNWLLQVGEGQTPRITRYDDLVEIPQSMMIENNLIDVVFGNNLNNMTDEELSRRVILVSTNAQALDINREIVSRLGGDPVIFYSADSLQSDDENDAVNFPVEFLNELTPSGMPPHCLLLKPGAVIMLLRNLNPKKGLCNGTRLIVEGTSRNTISARIISECNRGDIVIIPRIVLAPSDSNLPFILRRRQFPVTLAFSMTITKSQGQTFDHVGIDLQTPVFSHGQLYVSLSRASDAANLKVKITQTHEQGRIFADEREFSRNVVFKEIFNA